MTIMQKSNLIRLIIGLSLLGNLKLHLLTTKLNKLKSQIYFKANLFTNIDAAVTSCYVYKLNIE